jgi:hypothetical protein
LFAGEEPAVPRKPPGQPDWLGERLVWVEVSRTVFAAGRVEHPPVCSRATNICASGDYLSWICRRLFIRAHPNTGIRRAPWWVVGVGRGRGSPSDSEWLSMANELLRKTVVLNGR